ncbi:sugar-binding domain-containing protein, partial [Rathayibacter tanaceti]
LLEQARAAGAAGHALGQFFDRAGRPVASALDELRVGLALDELRAIPLRILVAHGSTKAEAIAAAATGGIASALVTDEATAEELLRR